MSSSRPSPRFNSPSAPSHHTSALSSPSSHRSRSSRVRFESPLPDSLDQHQPLASDDEAEAQLRAETISSVVTSGGSGTYLAVRELKGRIGCFVYERERSKLFFLEDQQDTPQWSTVQAIIEQTRPVKVYTETSADDTFVSALQQFVSSDRDDSRASRATDPDTDSTKEEDDAGGLIDWVPAREFNAERGKACLRELTVVEGDKYDPTWGAQVKEGAREERLTEEERRLSADEAELARIREDDELRAQPFTSQLEASPLALGCAAILIPTIKGKLRGEGNLTVEREGLIVAGLEQLSLDQFLIINFESLNALNIFKPEAHASSYQREPKEGASLFGLMDICKTPMGKARLRSWFLRPSRQVETIRHRQNAIECLLRSDNFGKTSKLLRELKMIRNAPSLVRMVALEKAKLVNWKSLYNFTFAAIKVREIVSKELGQREGISCFDKVLSLVDPEDMHDLGCAITSVIDWDASSLGSSLVVRSGLSDQLDYFRHQRDGVPSLLMEIAAKMRESLPVELGESLDAVYYPQMGYLAAVPWQDSVDEIRSIVEGTMFEYMFLSETHAYLKAPICRELDDALGDVANVCKDEELKILDQLTYTVTASLPLVNRVCDAIAELDCLVAMAVVAEENAWVKPKVVEEPVVKIQNGHHPIVARYVDNFVKNDTIITGGRGAGATFWDEHLRPTGNELAGAESVFIVTGANYSGKSVYLKQVAVITFMAHVGSFVPAERATIGLTDKILTKLVTRESITSAESAFMIDLTQISFILRNATERSLIVLDEIGKGTTAHDGAGVFAGVLEELVNRGNLCPRALVASHFQNVFRHGLLPPELPIGIANMEIIIPTEADGHRNKRSKSTTTSTERITYLYNLVPGLAKSSQAGACALLHGIPLEVVQEAAQVTQYLDRLELELFIEDHEGDQAKLEDYEKGERTARELFKFEAEGREVAKGNAEVERMRAIDEVDRICEGQQEVQMWVDE